MPKAEKRETPKTAGNSRSSLLVAKDSTGKKRFLFARTKLGGYAVRVLLFDYDEY